MASTACTSEPKPGPRGRPSAPGIATTVDVGRSRDRPRRRRRSRHRPPRRSRSARGSTARPPLRHQFGAAGAPPLVVRQPVLDGEHVAVLDDQVVAPQAEGRGDAEHQLRRIPPDHRVGIPSSPSKCAARRDGRGRAGSPSGRLSTESFDRNAGSLRGLDGCARMTPADRSAGVSGSSHPPSYGPSPMVGTTSRSRARVAAT
jgi:hypothetical protein